MTNQRKKEISIKCTEISKTRNKGITLIALVITIIVMMILVGVTVTIAINGGLFETAKKAARKTEKAKLNEEIQTIIAAMNADLHAHPENHNLTDADIIEGEQTSSEIEDALIFKKPVKNIEDNFKIKESLIKIYTYGGEKFRSTDTNKLYNENCIEETESGSLKIKFPCTYKETTEINIIVELRAGEKGIDVVSYALSNNTINITETTEKVEVTAGGNIKEIREGAPIPKGFYYVTGTKDTGVVISDNPADENNESGNNGNQFVWVPVEINPKINIKIDSNKNIKTVRILNSQGLDETIEVNSDVFSKEIIPEKNDVYEIITTYEDGTIEDKLYETNNLYKKSNMAYKDLKVLAILSGITEDEVFEMWKDNNPDAVVDTKMYIIKEIEKTVKGDGTTTEDAAVETESVLKYGGFYIGRYEAGADGSVRKNAYPDRNITFVDAKTKAEAMYKDDAIYGVKSGLPSSSAWDATCNWLANTSKTWEEVYYSSKSWGNYRDKAIGGQGTLYATGSSDRYEANNIYDLAGNIQEWTTEIEKNGENLANTARGSYYQVIGNPNVFSDYAVTSSDQEFTGYRPILYIK